MEHISYQRLCNPAKRRKIKGKRWLKVAGGAEGEN